MLSDVLYVQFFGHTDKILTWQEIQFYISLTELKI